MKFPKGVRVPKAETIHECFEVVDQKKYWSFAINVDETNIMPLVRRFCESLPGTGYFILETPLCHEEEKKLRKTERDPCHRHVYFLPYLDRDGMLGILDRFGGLLVQDGMSTFGFASHDNKDEIFVGKYKLTNIFAFSRDLEKYRQMLSDMGIPEEKEIRTAWSTFTKRSPGELERLEVDGMDMYEVAKALEPEGLFLVKTIEG